MEIRASNAAACADSELGFCKPPPGKLLTQGTPNMPAPTMTSSATATIRRGAAMASRATFLHRDRPSPEESQQ
jgi:hypothetical protein